MATMPDDGSPPAQGGTPPRPDASRPASRRFARRQVPWTVAGLFLLSALLPAALFVAMAVERRVVMWETARRDTDAVVNVLQQHAQKLLETQELVLDLVEDLVRGASDEAVAAEQTSNRLAEIAVRLPQTVSIWVGDARGRILAGSAPPPPGQDMADRDYFVAQIDTPSPRYVSARFTGRVSRASSFAISRRRPSADGTFTGTIHVAVSAEYVEDALRVAASDMVGAATLLREDGVLLARFPPRADVARLSPEGQLMRAIAAQPQAGSFYGSSVLDGIDRVYAYRRIAPFPVYVGFGVDMPTREAEWAAAVLRDAALALFCMLVLGSATWFTWRSMRLRTAAAAALRAEADRRHMAESRLEQARSLEALGRMARGVAHDFNNLLTVVIGNLETLEEGTRDPLVRDAARRSRRAAEAGAELAGSLLAFARTQMLRVEPARLDRLLREMRPLLQDLATAGIELRLELPGEVAACRCDVAQFRAAIGNLVSNARDAMPKGGLITISVREAVLAEAELQGNPAAHPGRFVATSVSDTGTGMSREVVARAFEPFFTTKSPGSGSGLGLSHVYGLVSQLGGIATLRSELGFGTTVTLYLPVAAEAPPAAPDPSRQDGPARAATRVLVVDDKPEIRQLAGTILRRAGYEVETAPGGAEALMLFEGGARFDLVVSDVVMQGGLDGVSLVRRLRAEHPGLAALLVTGYAPDSAALGASGAGVLAKPFTRQALLSAVEGALAGAGQLSPAGPGRA
jgi:signal transduction histidine kinase/ActR/RegA family two-component response regulator